MDGRVHDGRRGDMHGGRERIDPLQYLRRGRRGFNPFYSDKTARVRGMVCNAGAGLFNGGKKRKNLQELRIHGGGNC